MHSKFKLAQQDCKKDSKKASQDNPGTPCLTNAHMLWW